MAPLEPLAPDQRAVVSLVLQQGRSYEEIASLLGIAPEAVRTRAHAGLAALAPANGLPAEITGPIADYLLGQQPPRDAEATRGLLAESAPARDWAAGVAEHLAGAAPHPLPEVPGGDDAPAAPAPAAAAAAAPVEPVEPARAGTTAPPRASRLGGALLIAGALAVLGVVLFLVLRGGDDDAPEQAATPAATATATPSPTAAPQVADEIPMRPPGGDGEAQGAMTVFLQDGVLQFALQAVRLPDAASTPYAVWVQKGDRYRRLGFANAAQDGTLAVGGPTEDLRDAFPQLYATYDRVLVSQETTDTAREPTRVVLTGRLPSGR
ncbi:MAG TPA: sigma-70 region 4 domain-containing protein [Solirubrobacteraceae bacterium]|nr:sigma-70 region 4 domain-containing protein [Solirubrobacteraceae bacterium]